MLSLSLGLGRSYISLISLLMTHFAIATSYATHCIQGINLHLLDPRDPFQEGLHSLTYAMTCNDEDTPNYTDDDRE